MRGAINREKRGGGGTRSAFTFLFTLFCPCADGDAGAEGGEEGSVRLYANQLTALISARETPEGHFHLPSHAPTPKTTLFSRTSTHAQRFFILTYWQKIGTLFYFFSHFSVEWSFLVEITYHQTTFITPVFLHREHMLWNLRLSPLPLDWGQSSFVSYEA